VPYDEAYQEGFEDMERRVPDITKISDLIGYKNSCDLNTILAKVVEYEKTKLASKED
jgi:UDP-glucose 4-epimerase